ncbi:MAG: MCE family protein [Verrucomicrobia bacterium]|nr:MCE family protein [Verrucomicrobiota bacterium]
MSAKRLEWKVGLFVFIALVLAAALLIQFSKGASWFKPSYELLLKTRNVGGIKRGAAVLMAGVQVGSVQQSELTPSGREVIVHLRISRDFVIHRDATFAIEQAGFLGDQYVSIMPGDNKGPRLEHKAIVACEEPFNLQEAARAATGFLNRVDETAAQLNQAVVRLDRTLLSEENLVNLTNTFANFRRLSERALRTVEDVGGVVTDLHGLVVDNAAGVGAGISNLVGFSEQLNRLAADLQATLQTNRGQLGAALDQIEEATERVNGLLRDLQSGRGLAGGLLQDDQLRAQMQLTLSNLAVVSSNLARFGLLYKPKPTTATPRRPSPLFPERRL